MVVRQQQTPRAPVSVSKSNNSSPPSVLPASPSNVGRIKAPPVCVDAVLKESAMSASELSELTFSSEIPKTSLGAITVSQALPRPPSEAIPVSSSSSTCTRESAAECFSDVEIGVRVTGGTADHHPRVIPGGPPSTHFNKNNSRLNAKVAARITSRQGRSTQRWVTDTESNETVRLVTGCVPILSGGKILFASASRKPEWILPKGGWEMDESLEESAVRESFEEAGVLGVLGPRLSEIQFETRKAKKRRLELEELLMSNRQQQRGSKKAKHHRLVESATSDVEKETSAEDMAANAAAEDDTQRDSNRNSFTCQQPPPPPQEAPIAISDEVMSRIRAQAQTRAAAAANKPSDDSMSVASNATTVTSSTNQHSQVRMTLFPLYVTKVFATWPESGRFRRAVDIDEAILLCKSRPELKAALMEVKERGLHLRVPPAAAVVASPQHKDDPSTTKTDDMINDSNNRLTH